uniref:DH domain-containing protein n=1 Tax=Knipowitschia caucasica TaxID=637954 RepID=A0AAV2JFI1_KNICA
MVCELKLGFGAALSELSQIQTSDSFIRDELEDNRRSCHKRAHRLETLVDTLRQVAMQLLHSEWEYVSTLNQLYERYRRPPDYHLCPQPYETYVSFVEQLLQRQLLFRNTLQERLSAQHWKSLIGDVLVQLLGHNDSSFSDMYLGYTRTLASFLSLEFNRLKQQSHKQQSHKQQSHKQQSGDQEQEEMKLLSLLLAPVSRIHGYLSHIQSLLQWTGKDHPDCSLLLGSERSLRSLLNQCHEILEQNVRWEEPQEPGVCSDTTASGGISGNCREDKTGAKSDAALAPCPSLRVECLSCSPIRRKSSSLLQKPSPPDPRSCPHCCSLHLLTPQEPAPLWGETSDSGQGTYSHSPGRAREEVDSDSFSSVTSCSMDENLRREEEEEGEEEEEDSHVPVLLKPRERTVCLRWQIPRLTPHPPLHQDQEKEEDEEEGMTRPTILKTPRSPPKSAFRPIWDDPSKQLDSAPERDCRQVFIPIQTPRPSFHLFNTHRENLRQNLLQQRGAPPGGNTAASLWDDSDSEGPCSTV